MRVAFWATLVGLGVAAIDLTLPPYQLYVVGRLAVLIIVTLSLNILMGNAGLLSLAGASFMGTGAYGTVVLMNLWKMPFPIAAVIVVTVAWGLGWLMGAVTLRLSGLYLALVTFGYLVTFQAMLIHGADSVTGAGYGLIAPTTTMLGSPISADAWAAVSAFSAGAAIVLARTLVRSRIGRAWKAMKFNHTAAEQNGMNLTRLKTSAFALTAAMSAFAGTLYAFLQGAVNPEQFGLAATIQQLCYVVVGGVGSVFGSIIGPIVVELIPEFLRPAAEQRELLFGVLLIVTLIIAPRGLAGAFELALARGMSLIPSLRLPAVVRRHRDRLVRRAEAPSERREPTRSGVKDSSGVADGLCLESVTVGYGGILALRGLTFVAKSGHLHGVIGPNGAGKTTAVNAIVGLARLDEGSIRVRGELLRSTSGGVSMQQMAHHGITRTFQSSIVVPNLSPIDNVMLGLHTQLKAGIVTGTFRSRRVRAEEASASTRCVEMLSRVGFGKDMRAPASNWSAGEARRIELARVLVQQPHLLILDEPTAGLEPGTSVAFMKLLRQLQAESPHPLTIVMVEHNLKLVFDYCDAVTVMDRGVAVITGDPATVRENQEVRRAYLGLRPETAETVNC
jgi:ABC-type branched-subunit amino acid transport system ATPase component/ABC-type branched-subunit amino acid transport system permease subunit